MSKHYGFVLIYQFSTVVKLWMDRSLQRQSCPQACLPVRDEEIKKVMVQVYQVDDTAKHNEMSCKSVFRDMKD